MKILHTENSQGWGGQEIRILSEMRGMAARGHVLELACAPGARIEEEARRAGLAVTVLPIARKRLPGVLALRRFIAARGFDVVNTHSSTDSWLSALACASLRGAPPIVRTRHISAPVPDNAATRWLYTRATRRIVTTGEALKARLVRDNGFPAEAIVSVPTGIDLARFVPRAADVDAGALRARAGVPRDARVIGIVATLRSWKGHRYLVEAVAALGRADVVLLIVGDGPQRAALEGLVAGLKLGGRVVFAGNQGDVLPWLHAIDVFALPSYANEGVPQAILQAFACALPVVTTDAGAIGEVARDGDTALVVQKESAADLARGLARLLDDPGLARRLGENARALVRARHGHDAMLDAMEAVFRAAIARP
ncbi:MAG: glycosyltransferase family 4 protein [Burkholderiales bacterium]|nr:glycosyltransferase family 4 protein [Burkholderiales bacterium]